MKRILIFQVDPEVSRRLQSEMMHHDWAVDICNGTLEMLRAIQEEDYEIAVLSSDHMSVELSMLMGAIKTLQKKPRIVINLSGIIDSLVIANLARDGTLIRGALTPEKLLEITQNKH